MWGLLAKTLLPRIIQAVKSGAGQRAFSYLTSVIRRTEKRTARQREMLLKRIKVLWMKKDSDLRSLLSKRIKRNLLASISKGGTLQGDIIHGSSTWKAWSPSYAEWRRKHGFGGGRKGVLTGEMLGEISVAELPVKIEFRGRLPRLSVNKINVDFKATGVGKKMRLFHHGRSGQPGRPFTFLTSKDLDEVTIQVKKLMQKIRAMPIKALRG